MLRRAVACGIGPYPIITRVTRRVAACGIVAIAIRPPFSSQTPQQTIDRIPRILRADRVHTADTAWHLTIANTE